MREFLATTKGKVITGVVGILIALILVIVFLFVTGVLGDKDKKEPTNPSEEGGLIIGDPEDLEEDSVDFSEIFAEEKDDKDGTTTEDKKDDTSTDDKKNNTSTDDKKNNTSTDDKKNNTPTDDKKDDTSDDKKDDTLDSDTTDNGGTNWSPLY